MNVVKAYLKANHDPSAPENRLRLPKHFANPSPVVNSFEAQRDLLLDKFSKPRNQRRPARTTVPEEEAA
jgi:hypothetical protein